MTLKYAILGLLDMSPKTGYSLKKFLEGAMGGFWSVSFGGLYPALHKLVVEGLIEVEELEDARNQKTYTLTEKGRQELAEWFLQKTSTPQNKNEFMLKIFLSQSLSSEKRAALLSDYLQYKKELVQRIKDETRDVELNRGTEIVTRYSIIMIEQELKVLHDFINEELGRNEK